MKVTIGLYVDAIEEVASDAVIVAVDVIRSTTTAMSAVAAGHRCFVAPSLDAAEELRARLGDAYLIGELGGNMPFGFDATNSPVAVSELAHRDRPVVLLSSSGTRLMTDASTSMRPTYVASLRNWRAQAAALARAQPAHVLVLGAATRGEFREEDQLCCAWIADSLIERGFDADEASREMVARWRGKPASVITRGKSAAYLKASGQLVDLEFILSHIDDLQDQFTMNGDEVCIARDVA